MIRAQASLASKRYLRASGGFKEKNLLALDVLLEEWVSDGLQLDQVDRRPEKALKVFLKVEIVRRVFGGRHLGELDEEIDIAAPGLESAPRTAG